MNLSAIASQLVSLGKTFLPLLVPGAGPILTMASKVADAIDEGKHIFSATDQAALTATTDALRTKVNAHVDSTIAKLRNG
jgi:short-subunit dehydrogenase